MSIRRWLRENYGWKTKRELWYTLALGIIVLFALFVAAGS